MSRWSPAAFGGALFVAVHYLLLRAASGRIADRLGALVLESSACVGIAASLAFGGRAGEAPTTRAGVGWAAASGLAVSGASILLFTSLRRGGPVAATGTIVLGGGVALSAVAAPWLYGETFTARRALGVALGLLAMWVLGGES
jgi:drug/metabolite transporter (DMT)-like permease